MRFIKEMRTIGILLLMTLFVVGGLSCSALLDTDSLNENKDGAPADGEPYPMGMRTPSKAAEMEQKLALAGPVEIDFHWKAVMGRPAQYDLSLASSPGNPLFQVFTRDDRPFARSGLKVIPLLPTERYQLRLERVGHGKSVRLRATLLESGLQVVLRSEHQHPDTLRLAFKDRLRVVARTVTSLEEARIASAHDELTVR